MEVCGIGGLHIEMKAGCASEGCGSKSQFCGGNSVYAVEYHLDKICNIVRGLIDKCGTFCVRGSEVAYSVRIRDAEEA